jgi:hypothetical protein
MMVVMKFSKYHPEILVAWHPKQVKKKKELVVIRIILLDYFIPSNMVLQAEL